MPSSIGFTNTFKEAATKLLQKVYVKEGLENPNFWREIFNIMEDDSKRAFFQNHSIIPLGLLSPVQEGAVPELDMAAPGFTMQYVFTDYGLRYEITRRAEREDPKNIFNLMPRMLRRSVDETMEYLFWIAFNSSFLSYAEGGYNVDDGHPLISSFHPLPGLPGVVQSNFLGNVAFTPESLQAAKTAMMLTRDDRGKLIQYIPKTVVYAPGYHQQVTEVLQTNLYPETNQNRINIAAQQRSKIEPYEVPYLVPNEGPGPYPWWLITKKGSLANSHTIFANIRENRQRTFIDQNTESIVHEAKIRIATGVESWRGIIASGGA